MQQRPRQRTIFSLVAALSVLAVIAVMVFSVQVNLSDAAGDTPTAEGTQPGGNGKDCATVEADAALLDSAGSSPPCGDLTATPDATDENSDEAGDPPTPTPGAGVIETPAGESTETPTEEATSEATEEAQMPGLRAAPALLQQQATTVSFTASIGADRTVQFTDTTVSDTAITGWLWTFGDGTTSTEQNPTHQYAADASYTVMLQVTLQGGAILSASGTVEIGSAQSEVMRCAFEMDPQGDSVPLTVNFNNTSENADSYAWSFGDGGTSADQHPAHTYTQVGTYTITLTCTGTLGTLTAHGAITVEETPGGDTLKAQFVASPTSGPAPLSVQVTDASLGAVTSWTWNFGDGSAEVTGQGPHTHVYSSVGSYTITLTVQNSQGDSSQVTGTIAVVGPGSAPQPGFTVTPQQGPAPLTVTVTDTSQGNISSWTWDFGDGSAKVTGQGPHTHTYTATGTYTIRLDVAGSGGAGTAARQVVVLPPGDEVDAAFSFQVTGSAPGGIEVCFTDASVGQVVAWLWTFGDGATSSAQNPCHTYAVAGNYTVTLQVTDALNNTSTGTRIVPVVTGNVAPVAAFTADRTDVTVGETVTFTNQSIGQITSYLWDFGDGNTSTLENPTHTYISTGTYTVSLIVSGPGGTSEAAQTTITVGEAVLGCDFSGTTSPRLQQTVTYNGQPSGLGTRTIASQTWKLDGSVVDNDGSFKNQWNTPGSYSLSYTVVLSDGSECTKTKTVTVSDSILTCSISGASNANAYQEREYTANLQGGSGTISYAWTVNGQVYGGDQKNISVIAPVGQSQLLLRVVITRGGQQCIAEKTVTINRGGADRLTCDFTGNLNPLRNLAVTYESATSHLYTRTATYEWLINGVSTSTSQNFTHTWAAAGSYQLTLRVTPSEGQPCEVSKTVTVSQQTLGCEITGSFPAYAGQLATYFAGTPGLGSRTATYQWLIDGAPAGTGQTLDRIFNTPGTAQLTLRVTASDNEECQVTRQLEIQVGQQINAIATPNAGVAPMPVTFTAQTTNIDRATLVWHYPNGTTQHAEVGTFLFTVPGEYTVIVTGTGPLGQQSASVVVRVASASDIRAAFTPNPFGGIAPVEICFTDRSVSEGSTLNSWAWDFGDGTTSAAQNPCHTYTQVGAYRVKLVVTNTAGLTASATNTINVFSVTQDASSFGFTIYPQGRVCFTSFIAPGETLDRWEFGDGATSTELNPCHTYPSGGDYTVSMWVSGVQISRTIRIQFTGTPQPPLLTAGGVCSLGGVATFTISNSGGSMAAADTYVVTSATNVELARGTFQLGPSDSVTVQVTGSGVITLRTLATQLTASTNCGEPPVTPPGTPPTPPVVPPVAPPQQPPAAPATPPVAPPQQPPAITVGEPLCGEITVQPVAGGGAGFPLIDMNPANCLDEELPLAAWTPIEVGGAVCPEWFVYHTNQTGDWEIFRYGDLPGNPGADANLSKGIGEGVYDIGPTRSPDSGWIAFASNRDGNWEIYVATTDGEFQQRVTNNTRAIDYDPVWSPTGERIVFESSRDGNWELYSVNVSTGEQTRLTNNPANDLNAFWSPDGTRLVFESDRDGQWQVYELDLATLAVKRLSDGTANDQEPSYSFDGKRVAFRSDRSGTTGVYVMNADGSDVQPISDPAGRATLPVWAPDDSLLAYQSDLNGQLDIYVYEFSSGATRRVTENAAPNYAPTWYCDAPQLILTSDVTGDSNLFTTPALPIDAAPVALTGDATQLTDQTLADQHPQNSPSEEDASRERSVTAPPRSR